MTEEEESIIVRAAKILMAPTPTPEPTSPAPTSSAPTSKKKKSEEASFGSFFVKSAAITGVILVAMNWDAITSFWVVTQ